jgi:diguanylate cyclase (GGDEF)-like protein
MKNDKILKIISNESKSSIDAISIVTPSMYASIFKKYAHLHNTEIEDEEEIASNLIQEQCSNLLTLQDKTSKNIHSLDENTTKAIDAIKAKDATVLEEILKETQALRKEVEKLKVSIYNDELTKAYNRKWLHDNYATINESNFKTAGILAIIDLNYFKQINDTLGHIVGDKVLVYITNELQKSKEPIIRYGGDEFLILFHESITQKKAISILDNIRENIMSKKLKAKDSTFKVSFSFGITEYQAEDNINDVIERADKIMYNDKVEIKKRVTGI